MGGPGEGSSSSTLGRVVAMLKARRGFARCLLEHPLRTQALSVQVECLMWVRNGFSLRTQSSIYSAQRFRCRDEDMLVLQLALALSSREEAEFVVPLFVERFELEALFRLDCVSAPFIGERPYRGAHAHMAHQSAVELGVGTTQQQIMCGEEMLRRLITLLSAREFVGDMTPEQRWRICLLHKLALGDGAHSEIIEWAQTCPAASGAEDNLALVVDDILATIATRVLANAETGYVYRLRPECWPEVDVHSVCIRTRKQQHDVELQLFQHAKSNPTLYTRPAAAMGASRGDTESKRRVPWLALHTIPVRPEVRSGLSYIARSASLSRLVCILLHNAARSFEATGSAGGVLPSQAVGAGGGWAGEPPSTRSSEMLVRQCLHLLFLALDLHEHDTSSAGGSSQSAQAHVPLADAYYAQAEPGVDSSMAAEGGAAASASGDLMPESPNIHAEGQSARAPIYSTRDAGMCDNEDNGAFGCLSDWLTGAGLSSAEERDVESLRCNTYIAEMVLNVAAESATPCVIDANWTVFSF